MSGKRSLIVLAIAVGAALVAAAPYVSTAAFLLDMAGISGPARSLLPVRTHGFTTRDTMAPTRHGEIVARIYLPPSPSATIVVFPGVHGGGVAEPRLARLCGRLASTGVTAICVPLPDLRDFRITGRSTDMIEDVTRWAAAESGLSRDGRVGLVGVSFAGGLALVAAGRGSLDGRLTAVMSLGGHGDLARTLRYLCTGRLPDGTIRPPHDYGLAVVALAAAPLIVPPGQAPGVEQTVRTYLEASLDATPEHVEGTRLFNEARRQASDLDEPARGLMLALTERNVGPVGKVIEPVIEQLTGDPALSPERSPAPTVPVFLVHGLNDNVIPSSETTELLRDYRSRGAEVTALLTPLLSHADLVGNVTAGAAWELLDFWKDAKAALR